MSSREDFPARLQPQLEQPGHRYIPTVNHHYAIIVPLPSLLSCFVSISGPPCAADLWQEQQRHFCRVLQLQKLQELGHKSSLDVEALGGPLGVPAQNAGEAAAASGARAVYVGWTGTGLGSADAVAAREAAAAAPAALQISETVCIGIAAPLCSLLGLRKGEAVVVSAVDVGHLEQQQKHQQRNWPYIASLEVAPLGRDDWDAVQLHAEALEDEMLEQVALVMPEQAFPLWIKGGIKPAMLRVCAPQDTKEDDVFAPPFFLLNQNTELHVRPLAQAAFRRSPLPFDSEASLNGVGGQTGSDVDILRVLPLREELYGVDSKRMTQGCDCCGTTEGKAASGGSWQYVCSLHPAHLTALQQAQQWLRPALRSGHQLLGAPDWPTEKTQKRLQEQRLVAAEEIALVCVRRAPLYGGSSGGREGDTSHALLLAAAADDVPLGCVRLPCFVRRLYGWAISSRVAVEPCKQVPTLPPCLLLTPLLSLSAYPQPEDAETEAKGGDLWCKKAGTMPVPTRVATFLETEEGRKKLLEVFLALTDAEPREETATIPARSADGAPGLTSSGEEPANSRGGSLFRVVWDGAVVRLRVPIRPEELRRPLRRSRAVVPQEHLRQQQQQKFGDSTVDSESARDGSNCSASLFQKSSADKGRREAEIEAPKSDGYLGAELQELEAGLVDLYVSSDAENNGDAGGVDLDKPESLADTFQGDFANGSSEERHRATENERPSETTDEWGKLASTCTVVEEFFVSSAQDPIQRNTGGEAASPETIETTAILQDTVNSQGLSNELHVTVDVIISFNAATGTDTSRSEPPPQDSPQAQRCFSPRFSQALPAAFAGLHGLQPSLGVEAELPAAFLFLDASLRNLVCQGGVTVGVTHPVFVSFSRGGVKEGVTELSLPLRFGSSPNVPGDSNFRLDKQILSPSECSPGRHTSASKATDAAFRLAVNAKMVEGAQRLWWLVPAPQPGSAAAASVDRNSGAEAQLLQLLQQGCVEVSSAELPFGLCSCGESDSLSPLSPLLRLGSSKGPFLEDFKSLRAFGEHPTAIMRAVYRRFGDLDGTGTCGASTEFEEGAMNSLPSASLNLRTTLTAERRAYQASRTIDVCTLLVCGPRGSGRSALCRAVCIDVRRRLGIFTITVHCRLLAREAIPSALVRQALAAAFEAAEANSPSIVVLEDLDVLCFSGEDGGDRPSVAEARGTVVASFLTDLIHRASGEHAAAGGHACGMESLRGDHGGPGTARRVLTLATAVGVSALHPILAHPLLFGSSKIHIQCDTSLVTARVELLRALLKFVTQPLARDSTRHTSGLPPDDGLPVLLDKTLLKETGIWSIASKLEGYSLADLQAVVARAVGESLLGVRRELSGRPNAAGSNSVQRTRHQAILCSSHLLRALKDVLPRATQQQSFIQGTPFAFSTMGKRKRIGFLCAFDCAVVSRPDLRYCHVGGLRKPKEDLHDLLTLQRTYPLLQRSSGISVHQGLLLIGPPGCGKTHLALAAVGEARIRCIHVKGPELLGKFIGSSEAAVRDVFQRAQAAKPCAILFDEIEALATKRGGDTTGVTDRVVNQLLCYLDGIEAREDVFVIATTSRPDLVDAALLRPGRLEKVCFCGLPVSDFERTEILAVSLKSLNTGFTFDVHTMGRLVPCTFTPADIQAAVNQAQLHAVQEVLARSSDQLPGPTGEDAHDLETFVITEDHLVAALQSSRPSLSAQEVQLYHRYCLPFLSQAYQKQVHTIERLIIASPPQAKKDDIGHFSARQSRSGYPVECSLPELTRQSQDRSLDKQRLVKDSGNNMSGNTSSATSPNSVSPRRPKLKPVHVRAKWNSTTGDEAGEIEPIANELNDEANGTCALGEDSYGRHGLHARIKQTRRPRRKGALPQLTGNRVALA